MAAHPATICVFGLGEAGSLIAADLARAGTTVNGYDPAPVATPHGVMRCDTPTAAVIAADAVIALTAAADAPAALQQAFTEIPPHALYADFATGSAGLKQQLAQHCQERDIAFADVALMAIVPGRGIRVPALAAGSGATVFADIFSALGMPVSVVGEQAGTAATQKLLRSIMMKGLAAVVIEAMQAAAKAGCSEWLWRNLADEITRADETLLTRLVRGTHTHATRRLHEMQASCELLEDLDVEPVMTRATVDKLNEILAAWPGTGEVTDNTDRALPAWWPRP